MGSVSHKALIVTGFDPMEVAHAHCQAHGVGLGESTTGILHYTVNSGASFAVLPSGSKKGWSEDDDHVRSVNMLIKWMKLWNPWDIDLTEERGNCLEWVFVEFGHPDESPNRIIDGSDL